MASLSSHSVIRKEVNILETFYSTVKRRKRAICILSELAKNDNLVNFIVNCGAVEALVRNLPSERDFGPIQYEHEVVEGNAFILGLLAERGLPRLVNLLRHGDGQTSRAVKGVIRRAADAISNIAHENTDIQSSVRLANGIPPLVELLNFVDPKVLSAVAGALRTLAFKNDENKQ